MPATGSVRPLNPKHGETWMADASSPGAQTRLDCEELSWRKAAPVPVFVTLEASDRAPLLLRRDKLLWGEEFVKIVMRLQVRFEQLLI